MKILIAIIVVAIIIAMVVLGVNLYMTIDNLQMSPIIQLSNTALTIETDTWALRGQIGDILSGHFSALAFLAVALSIILQNQANKQMRESIDKQEKAIKLQANSIEQQNKALEVQSKALEAQIEELKASREESEKQTEEFFIQNMNVKLDRYYKLLDNKLEADFNLKALGKLLTELKKVDKIDLDPNEKRNHKLNIKTITLLFDLIQFIFDEILSIKDSHSSIFKNILEEYKLRINNDIRILALAVYLIKNLKNESLKYAFIGLLDEKSYESKVDL